MSARIAPLVVAVLLFAPACGGDAAGEPDAGTADAGPGDAGTVDAGPPDPCEGVVCDSPGPCGAGSGSCDPETGACAYPPAAAGTVCRPAAGPCDAEEVCDGASDRCPGDVLVSSGALCREPSGDCDPPETCNGVDPACPPEVTGARALDPVDLSPQPFCWDRVAPTGNTLEDAFVVSDTEAWAVGRYGTILRYDGSGWSQVASGTREDLFGVWAAGPGQAWAVGAAGTVLRWDGQAWSAVAAGTAETLNDVWGSGPDDVWAVGARGTVRRFDGVGWTASEQPLVADLLAVGGTGPGDVFAVTSGYFILHFDGSRWSDFTDLARYGRPVSIYAAAPDSVWVANGVIQHWDGSSWELAQGRDEWFYVVGGSGPDDVWMVGDEGTVLHWDGTRIRDAARQGEATLLGVHAASASGAVAVGTGGAVRRFDGTDWLVDHAGLGARVRGIHGGGGSVFAATERGALMSHGGGAWEPVPGDDRWMFDVWAGAPDSAFFGSFSAVLGWDGSGWTEHVPATAVYESVHGFGEDDVWAVGGGGARHYDGERWSTEPVSGSILHGSDPGNVWVAAASGELHRWDGAAWHPVELVLDGDAELTDLWMLDGTDGWAAVRGASTLYRWMGDHWGPHEPRGPVPHDLNAVWGRSADDVWFVGDGGLVLRWDGAGWSELAVPTSLDLHAVWADADTVYLGGDDGVLLRWAP